MGTIVLGYDDSPGAQAALQTALDPHKLLHLAERPVVVVPG